MPLELVVPDFAWKVALTWSKALPYDEVLKGCEQDLRAWFYLVLKQEGKGPARPHYIGKVTKACVSVRLNNADHRRNHAADLRKYPAAKFLVSVAEVKVTSGKRSAQLIDHVETLLIMTAYHRDPKFPMRNKRKWFSHSISKSYVVTNEGLPKALPKEITLGICVRN